MRKKVAITLILVFSLLFVSCSKTKDDEVKEINISVAASLLEPINKIIDEYKVDKNIVINVNSGGSGTLKKQISSGADVGLFISANEKNVDELISEGLVDANKKSNPITNKLVLIKSNNARQEINDIQDLVKLEGKIAIGETSTVPAGEYAKESLINLGIWDKIQDKIIYCKDVTAVKAYVERGEVEAGFVYKSDALDIKNSTVVLEAPKDSHKEIIYTMAPIEGYKQSAECNDFMKYINSDKAKEILKEYGFSIRE